MPQMRSFPFCIYNISFELNLSEIMNIYKFVPYANYTQNEQQPKF